MQGIWEDAPEGYTPPPLTGARPPESQWEDAPEGYTPPQSTLEPESLLTQARDISSTPGPVSGMVGTASPFAMDAPRARSVVEQAAVNRTGYDAADRDLD